MSSTLSRRRRAHPDGSQRHVPLGRLAQDRRRQRLPRPSDIARCIRKAIDTREDVVVAQKRRAGGSGKRRKVADVVVEDRDILTGEGGDGASIGEVEVATLRHLGSRVIPRLCRYHSRAAEDALDRREA